MKLGFKRGQKGFTLVELMVVMAIMAVLAAIVFPAVSGTSEVAGDSQVKQDAGTVSNAINDYFADQTGAEVITTKSTALLGSTANATKQVISDRWPETYLQDTYTLEFPTSAVNGAVNTVNITDTAGAAIGSSSSNTTILTAWNAISWTKLSNYIPAIPKNSDDKSTGGYHNYLWLVKKTTASGGVSGGSRAVEVFKLVGVTKAETNNNVTLVYAQIY